MDSSNDADNDLKNPTIATKYRLSGDIASKILKTVSDLCVPGASVHDISIKGDAAILEETGKLFKKKKAGERVEKGIAFPTVVSVNNIVAYDATLSGDKRVLAEGDLVKIELGVHVDGYIAVAGRSIVCGGVATGRVAELLAATKLAAEVVHHALQPGISNEEITELIAESAAIFDCAPVERVSSFQIERWTIDAEKQISNAVIEAGEEKLDCGKVDVEEGEVYSIDIKLSSGAGKIKYADVNPTVYKRNPDQRYNLKTTSGKATLKEIEKAHHCLPFALRNFEPEIAKAKLGLQEMLQHDLVTPFNVAYEAGKGSPLIATYRFTAMITSAQTLKIAPSFDEPEYAHERAAALQANKRLQETLDMPIKRKKKKNKRADDGDEAPQLQPMDMN